MRRSLSIASAAELLDTSRDTIRDMLNKGQLSGHYLRRERRVYLDSIEEYQLANEIPVKAEASSAPARRSASAKTDAARTLERFGI